MIRDVDETSHGRTGRMLLLVVITELVGIGAGVAGSVVAALLRVVQRLAYGYDTGSFLSGVEDAAPAVRVVALGVAGLVGGLGWWALRRWGPQEVRVEDALEGRTMPISTTFATVSLQI